MFEQDADLTKQLSFFEKKALLEKAKTEIISELNEHSRLERYFFLILSILLIELIYIMQQGGWIC